MLYFNIYLYVILLYLYINNVNSLYINNIIYNNNWMRVNIRCQNIILAPTCLGGGQKFNIDNLNSIHNTNINNIYKTYDQYNKYNILQSSTVLKMINNNREDGGEREIEGRGKDNEQYIRDNERNNERGNEKDNRIKENEEGEILTSINTTSLSSSSSSSSTSHPSSTWLGKPSSYQKTRPPLCPYITVTNIPPPLPTSSNNNLDR